MSQWLKSGAVLSLLHRRDVGRMFRADPERGDASPQHFHVDVVFFGAARRLARVDEVHGDGRVSVGCNAREAHQDRERGALHENGADAVGLTQPLRSDEAR